MAIKPSGIVDSDYNVKLFTQILKEANNELVEKVNSGDYSTNTRRKKLLKQIDNLVEEKNLDAKAWTRLSVASQYEAGLFEATKDLHNRGSKVKIKTSFSQYHKDTLEALSQETYSNIAQGMSGLSRTGERLVSGGTRQALQVRIGKGSITGSDIRKIRNDIKKTLKEQGITSLVDKAGREWDLNRYGEMLARTKLTQAHNTGVVNRMQQMGYDLVFVSSHVGACPLCTPYENQVLSVSGTNKAYLSLDDAKSGGLFHPNCRHAITPYHAEYLDEAKVWNAEKQQYEDFNQYKVRKINIPNNTSFKAELKRVHIPLTKAQTVYRAEDSRGAGATLGQGKYFAFDKRNAERYGVKIGEYVLDPKAKMLNLQSSKSIDRFFEEARNNNVDKFVMYVDKIGTEEARAKIMTEYAQRLGYEGIISDDGAFGSVVFESGLLKPLKSKAGRDIVESLVLNDLHKYEQAFNGNDVATMEALRSKHPGDARFKIHLKFAQDRPTASSTEFSKILHKHKQDLDAIGIKEVVEFNRLIEKGKKAQAKKLLKTIKNGEVRGDLTRLLKYI